MDILQIQVMCQCQMMGNHQKQPPSPIQTQLKRTWSGKRLLRPSTDTGYKVTTHQEVVTSHAHLQCVQTNMCLAPEVQTDLSSGCSCAEIPTGDLLADQWEALRRSVNAAVRSVKSSVGIWGSRRPKRGLVEECSAYAVIPTTAHASGSSL